MLAEFPCHKYPELELGFTWVWSGSQLISSPILKCQPVWTSWQLVLTSSKSPVHESPPMAQCFHHLLWDPSASCISLIIMQLFFSVGSVFVICEVVFLLVVLRLKLNLIHWPNRVGWRVLSESRFKICSCGSVYSWFWMHSKQIAWLMMYSAVSDLELRV